jgi:hypothetical protein
MILYDRLNQHTGGKRWWAWKQKSRYERLILQKSGPSGVFREKWDTVDGRFGQFADSVFSMITANAAEFVENSFFIGFICLFIPGIDFLEIIPFGLMAHAVTLPNLYSGRVTF